MILVLEGTPGAGKSTLINNLMNDPLLGDVRKAIHKPFLRSEVITLLDSVNFDPDDSIEKLVVQMLPILQLEQLHTATKEGGLIVIDRFLESLGGMIYAYFFPKIPAKKIYEAIQKVIPMNYGILEITIPFDVGMYRFSQRKGHSYDASMENFLQLMIEYLRFVESTGEIAVHKIDGLLPKESVYAHFTKIYRSLVGS